MICKERIRTRRIEIGEELLSPVRGMSVALFLRGRVVWSCFASFPATCQIWGRGSCRAKAPHPEQPTPDLQSCKISMIICFLLMAQLIGHEIRHDVQLSDIVYGDRLWRLMPTGCLFCANLRMTYEFYAILLSLMPTTTQQRRPWRNTHRLGTHRNRAT